MNRPTIAERVRKLEGGRVHQAELTLDLARARLDIEQRLERLEEGRRNQARALKYLGVAAMVLGVSQFLLWVVVIPALLGVLA